jgi:hypothetical protein
MKISEIQRLEGKQLFEAIDRENNSGASTEDLVRIVEAHRKNQWQVFESVESFENYLNALVEDK